MRTLTVITTVSVSEVRELRERVGGAFLDKAFAKREQVMCLRRRRPDHGLAARYAAREGLRRACEELGLGVPSSPEDAEIVHDTFGAPAFRLSGVFCEEVSSYELALSLAHDGSLACAVVVMQSAADEQ